MQESCANVYSPRVPMTIVCAVLVLVGALALGQAVLDLCGARAWSWLAPGVGISMMMLITVPALHVPGRATTTAAALGLAVVAAVAYLAGSAAQRPPLLGILAGVPLFLLALIPFAAAGHTGTLGVSFNNDMASHLLLADAHRSAAIAAINPVPDTYPLGPHALVGTLAQGLGITVDVAFSGFMIALPVLLGWTALGALRSPRWWGPFVTAPLAGMTFLVAGYYGQGSFKEVLQPVLVLAVAIALAFPPTLSRRRRWVPLAALLTGIVSVFSHLGLAWPLLFLALWAVGTAAGRLRETRSLAFLIAGLRRETVPVLLAVGIFIVALAPQIPRTLRFISDTAGSNVTGLPVTNLGNLAGPIPLWEAFGIWSSADYRVSGPDLFENGMWAAFVVGLVVFGSAWSLRRHEWMLPAATAATLLIWWVSEQSQSPYVSAKGLVVLAPFLMVVAVRPLVEGDSEGLRMPPWWRFVAPGLAAILLFKVIGSSEDALAFSNVGPTEHVREIASIRPLLAGRPTLYLGNDDFTKWLFADVPVGSPVIAFPSIPTRPEKPWEYGRNYDIDSLDVATLNTFDWVVTPRDAAGSAFPEQLRRVSRTASFDVYRRTATIPERQVLAEGEASAAPLDCTTAEGRTIVAGGGVAAVREAPVTVPAPVIEPGRMVSVELPLGPGLWDLVSPYGGPRSIEVTGPGLHTTLPGVLSRPGPRWPIGRLTVTKPGPATLTFRPSSEALSPDSALTYITSITAVPVGSERTVPVAAACGRLVDWYRPARK
jgi:hypothetical protein